MHTLLLLLAPLLTLASPLLGGGGAPRAISVVSPDKSCGAPNSGYTCPGSDACCSQYNFCGSTDAFCLTTAGCQTRYSNATSSCYAPRSGVTITIDGTCGSTGVGKSGYRCPTSGLTCCSAAGYCGNTTDHCSATAGCQSGFGTCTGKKLAAKSRSLPLDTAVDAAWREMVAN